MRSYVFRSALFAASFAGVGVLANASASAAPSVHVIGVRPAVAGARDLGLAPPSRLISVTVTYARRHAAELASLIAAQSWSGSPQRGHFLTPNQFDAYFAPSQATVAGVERAFVNAGFRPSGRTTGSVERFVGTAARAEAFFGTRIDAIAQAGGPVGYANVTPARVPNAIVRDVAAITGLDDLMTTHARPWSRGSAPAARPAVFAGANASSATFTTDASNHARLDTNRCTPATAPNTVDVDQPQTSAIGTTGFGPGTFESDFDFPIERGCGGAGVTVALVDAEEAPPVTDITQYYAAYGVKRTLPPYTTRAVSPSTLLDATEITLDTDLVSALAPNANVVLYMTDAGADGIANAMNAVAADNTASVLSTSFITCEAYGSDYFTAQDSAAQQLAAQGITTVAGAGDTMYENCFGNAGVGDPGSSSYVVSVGGVQPATSTSAYRRVSGWSGTTGGTSMYAAKPKYQNGIAACNTAYRCVPDLALASGAGTYPVASTISGGAIIYQSGVAESIAGTSVAAPMFAAMQAEADQYAGRRMGAINPILYADYALLGSSSSADPFAIFTDVTTGSSTGTVATKGWDFITGLGVPDGVKLARVEAL